MIFKDASEFLVVWSIPAGRAMNKSGCYMIFHVAFFFGFLPNITFCCPPGGKFSLSFHQKGRAVLHHVPLLVECLALLWVWCKQSFFCCINYGKLFVIIFAERVFGQPARLRV